MSTQKLTQAQLRDLAVFARKRSWGAAKTAPRLAALGLIEPCGSYDYTTKRPRIHVVHVTDYRITAAGRAAWEAVSRRPSGDVRRTSRSSRGGRRSSRRSSRSSRRGVGTKYLIMVKPRHSWGGQPGGRWRPAIAGMLNQTSVSDEKASTFDTHGEAIDVANALVVPIVGEGDEWCVVDV
jgi:hypothetical protein